MDFIILFREWPSQQAALWGLKRGKLIWADLLLQSTEMTTMTMTRRKNTSEELKKNIQKEGI